LHRKVTLQLKIYQILSALTLPNRPYLVYSLTMSREEKNVVWLGNSLDALQAFPKVVRADLGADLRRLQIGEMPLDSKPMRTVGPGVRELRARDRNNQFRAMYVVRKGSEIVVLHCFIKKSRTTSKADINTAKERLKAFDGK